jgi:hypothetical protein
VNNGDPWTEARRIEAWAGEVRVNLIRLAALLIFYGHHLVNVYVIQDEPAIQGVYHATVTLLFVAWTTAAAALHLCLTRRWVSPQIKYVSTLWDVALTTVLVAIAPDGPRSALLALYFLIIASTALRLSLPLVYVATFVAMAGYLLVLGYYVFLVVGQERYYASAELRIPRTQQVIWLLGLWAAGALAGQSVRQARRLVRGYVVAVAEEPEEKP